MTKNSKFVKCHYLNEELPPLGTMTEHGKILSYNLNTSITFSGKTPNKGGCILFTETGNCHQDTLQINSVKLLDCKRNKKWIC